MNRIGTQVLMANGISRRRFLVDSAGIAAGAGLSLAMKGTDTNQSGLAPAEITNQGKDTKGNMSTITTEDRLFQGLGRWQPHCIQSRLRKDRHAWIQLIEGDLDVDGEKLLPGDGASIDEEKELYFTSEKGAHFLLFDLN